MKQSVLMGSLGKLGDQFVLEGYKPEASFAEKIRRLSQIEDLQGVEFSCTGKERDAKMAASALADSGLVCSSVDLFIANRRVYGNGALSSTDVSVRRQAVDECLRAAEFAQAVGTDILNIWPGQDGYFQWFLCIMKSSEDFQSIRLTYFSRSNVQR